LALESDAAWTGLPSLLLMVSRSRDPPSSRKLRAVKPCVHAGGPAPFSADRIQPTPPVTTEIPQTLVPSPTTLASLSSADDVICLYGIAGSSPFPNRSSIPRDGPDFLRQTKAFFFFHGCDGPLLCPEAPYTVPSSGGRGDKEAYNEGDRCAAPFQISDHTISCVRISSLETFSVLWHR